VRRAVLAVALAGGAALGTGTAAAGNHVIIDQVSPIIWVMIAISAGGAAITYGFLVYALWRFKDPSTRRRNYG
jgi:hypothetical protein